MSTVNQRLSDIEDDILAERTLQRSLIFDTGAKPAGRHAVAKYKSGRTVCTAAVIIGVLPHQQDGKVAVFLNNKQVFEKNIAVSSIMSDRTLLINLENKTMSANLMEISLTGLGADGIQVLIAGEALRRLPL